jgi:hypothetical protein
MLLLCLKLWFFDILLKFIDFEDDVGIYSGES